MQSKSSARGEWEESSTSQNRWSGTTRLWLWIGFGIGVGIGLGIVIGFQKKLTSVPWRGTMLSTPRCEGKQNEKWQKWKAEGSHPKNTVWDGCRSVSYKWMGLDGWSPGGVKYRAAYAANKILLWTGLGDRLRALLMTCNRPAHFPLKFKLIFRCDSIS